LARAKSGIARALNNCAASTKADYHKTLRRAKYSASFIGEVFATSCGYVKSMFVNAANAIKNVILFPFKLISLAYTRIKAAITRLCDAIVSVVTRAYRAITSAVTRAYNAIVSSIMHACRAVVETVIAICLLPKRIACAIWNGAKRFVNSTVESVSFVIRSPLLLARHVSANRNQIYGVFKKPAFGLSLTFAIVAFVGLKVYDNQISKIEYSKGVVMARHAKHLLRQKQHKMHGYANENTAGKRKSATRNLQLGIVSQRVMTVGEEFQRTVDDFFRSHNVSEVMCDNGSCSMKIDNKIVSTHCSLTDDSEIFIDDSDGEHIVFADLAGNRCVKSIESLLMK
jgi:hypothetical protein